MDAAARKRPRTTGRLAQPWGSRFAGLREQATIARREERIEALRIKSTEKDACCVAGVAGAVSLNRNFTLSAALAA
jgi:hypothetical protein